MKMIKQMGVLSVFTILGLILGAQKVVAGDVSTDYFESLEKVSVAVKADIAKAQAKYELKWDNDEKKFVCKNAAGKKGYNKISADELKATLNGECADLYGADLHKANLLKVNLMGAILKYANLEGAFMHEADLKYADISHANMKRADLDHADFYNVNANGVNLVRAHMYQTKLEGAKMLAADMRYAYMYKADLYGADLRYADLYKAVVDDVIMFNAKYNDETTLPFSEEEAQKKRMVKVD